MLSPTYEITTALSHTDELISPPYDIAIVTISYGRVIMSSVWDSMMSKKNVGWPFYAAVSLYSVSSNLFLKVKLLYIDTNFAEIYSKEPYWQNQVMVKIKAWSRPGARHCQMNICSWITADPRASWNVKSQFYNILVITRVNSAKLRLKLGRRWVITAHSLMLM